jgi:hypothetical protein
MPHVRRKSGTTMSRGIEGRFTSMVAGESLSRREVHEGEDWKVKQQQRRVKADVGM